MTTVSLSEAAIILGRSSGWLQRKWRTIPGFPRPYVGAGHGEHPRWTEAAIRHFAENPPGPDAPKPVPANDDRPTPRKRPNRTDRLINLAGR